MVTRAWLPEGVSGGVRGYLVYLLAVFDGYSFRSSNGLDEAGRDVMPGASAGVIAVAKVAGRIRSGYVSASLGSTQ